jgi:hypothetical protein
MNKFNKFMLVAIASMSFTTTSFAESPLSKSDLDTCKMYLDQIANQNVMTATETKQANIVLKRCLDNHPTICSTNPLSSTTNCTHVQSNIELFGEAVPTQTPAPESTFTPPAAQPTAPAPMPITPAKSIPPAPAPTPAPANKPQKSTNTTNPYNYF